MLATFAFDVCHDVYRSAREVIDAKIPTLNLEACGKYTWHPDRLPRLAEYVADFARAGERALGGRTCAEKSASCAGICAADRVVSDVGACSAERKNGQTEARPSEFHRPSRMAMFRVYYLGGAEYYAARRHLGISELTWADWADEIRASVGRELTRSGVFPPARYFREVTKKAS